MFVVGKSNVKFTSTIERTVPKFKCEKMSLKRDLYHKGVYKNDSRLANIGVFIKMGQFYLPVEVNFTCNFYENTSGELRYCRLMNLLLLQLEQNLH